MTKHHTAISHVAPSAMRPSRFSGVMLPVPLLPDGDHLPPTPTPPAGPPAPVPPPAGPPAPQPPRTTPPAADPGFPADTTVSEMTPEQQAAYWRHESRKHQRLWEQAQGPEFRETARKAAEFDRLQREQLPAQERAVAEARDAALKEGREAAMAEANRLTVGALLSMALQSRGKTADEAKGLVRHINFDSFVNDGLPDEAAILAHVESIAGPGTGRGGKGPDFGQGGRGSDASGASTSRGADIWAQRHKRPGAA